MVTELLLSDIITWAWTIVTCCFFERRLGIVHSITFSPAFTIPIYRLFTIVARHRAQWPLTPVCPHSSGCKTISMWVFYLWLICSSIIVSLNKQYGVEILHGQGSTLQGPFSYAFPGHLSPPYCGFGLLHFLKVIFAPPSQGLLHSVSSQGPQFPWTSKNSDVN